MRSGFGNLAPAQLTYSKYCCIILIAQSGKVQRTTEKEKGWQGGLTSLYFVDIEAD